MPDETAVSPQTKQTWTPTQLHFMLWLALPEHQRQPRQQKQLAAQLATTESTLSNWKLLPGFGDEVFRLAKSFLRSSDLANILRAQVRRAMNLKDPGSTQAARFVFEAIGAIDSAGRATGGGDGAGPAPAGATAMAMAMSISVSSTETDKVSAERAAARQLLDRHTMHIQRDGASDDNPGP